MNALLERFEEKAWPFEVTRPLSLRAGAETKRRRASGNATRVCVNGDWIYFGISEKRSVVEVASEPSKGSEARP
jgi:hypothetical protein